MSETRGLAPAPIAAQIFGNAGIEYMEKYGVTDEQMAMIAEKNHKHRYEEYYDFFPILLILFS